ncbi:Hexokinase-2, chloroplastic [Glycine max]|nr:Hexokinase-2, chloroplastic [Glycine max]
MWPVKIGVESTEKWLDGHNRRRRKPQPSSLFMAAEKFMYNYKGSKLNSKACIDSSILINLTKGFGAGRDVVACLNEAMERQGIDMRLSALVNDTVALLAGVEYWDNGVVVARTNACYVEQISAIPKLQGHVSSSGQMVNKHLSPSTDWGAFSNGLPLTKINREMDVATINLGDEQIFEKTISGMYLGEIVRQVLLEMAEEGCLFGKCVPQKLSTPLILSGGGAAGGCELFRSKRKTMPSYQWVGHLDRPVLVWITFYDGRVNITVVKCFSFYGGPVNVSVLECNAFYDGLSRCPS